MIYQSQKSNTLHKNLVVKTEPRCVSLFSLLYTGAEVQSFSNCLFAFRAVATAGAQRDKWQISAILMNNFFITFFNSFFILCCLSAFQNVPYISHGNWVQLVCCLWRLFNIAPWFSFHGWNTKELQLWLSGGDKAKGERSSFSVDTPPRWGVGSVRGQPHNQKHQNHFLLKPFRLPLRCLLVHMWRHPSDVNNEKIG